MADLYSFSSDWEASCGKEIRTCFWGCCKALVPKATSVRAKMGFESCILDVVARKSEVERENKKRTAGIR